MRTGFNHRSGGLLKAASAVSGLFAQTPQEAARTPVVLATAPAPNGGFFAKGAPTTAPAPARDAALAEVHERTARALIALPRR